MVIVTGVDQVGGRVDDCDPYLHYFGLVPAGPEGVVECHAKTSKAKDLSKFSKWGVRVNPGMCSGNIIVLGWHVL